MKSYENSQLTKARLKDNLQPIPKNDLSDVSNSSTSTLSKIMIGDVICNENGLNHDWYDNQKEVLNLSKDKTLETRKTQLACLIVFVNSLTFNLIVYCYFKLIIKLYKSQNYVIQLIILRLLLYFQLCWQHLDHLMS